MSKVPKLRFPEFEGEWEEKELGELGGNIFSGGTPKTSNKEYYGGDIPFIRSAEINRNETELFLTLEGLNNSSAKMIEKGDLLIALYGANSGEVALAKINGAINQAILCFKSKSNAFVYQYLLLKKEAILSKYIQGGQGNLSGEIIKSIKILLPSLPEQQKIADCLSSLDELIEARKEKIASLKAYKKGLLQQLFPDKVSKSTPPPPLIFNKLPKLRFTGFEGEWEEVTIESIFKITRGNVLPMTLLKQEYSEEYPYPVYSSQTKNNGLAGYYNEFLYENAITWTTDGANAGEVNYRKEKFYCTNVCGVLISEKGYVNKCIAELINSVSKSYVSYVGNPKLMNGVMGSIKIQIPTEQKEQQKIADCLLYLDEKIAAETEQVTQLQQHKKGLLQQLLV